MLALRWPPSSAAATSSFRPTPCSRRGGLWSVVGNRAGFETALDTTVGFVGLVLVIEAARRSLGLALPLLSVAFLLYASFGSAFPSWAVPSPWVLAVQIIAQTFLHSQGIFGVALNVMFTYVFLFVIFGAFLEATGATRFIVEFASECSGGALVGPPRWQS